MSSPESTATERLQRTTLGARIADAVRNDVIYGRLRAGERLGQRQLTDRFGTSRMPVRDALRQLQHEGLLRPDTGGHLVVVQMRRQDILDTYEIEGMLHGLACRRVAENGTDEEFKELHTAHDRMLASERKLPAMAELNWRFHRRINQLARSQRLITALKALALQIPRDYLLEVPGWAHRANVEHEAIIEAVEAREGERAEKLMRQHVVGAGHDLLRFLESSGVDLG